MDRDVIERLDPLLFEFTKSLSDKEDRMKMMPAMFHMSKESVEHAYEQKTVKTLIHSKNTHQTIDELKHRSIDCFNSKNIVFAEIPIKELQNCAKSESVEYIESSIQLRPQLDNALNDVGFNEITPASISSGKDVIIGIIDTGIDWKHEDFIIDMGNEKRSRILYLLDQTQPGGKEFNNQEITDALNNNGSISSEDTNGHGTHVAGIAAGNGNASSENLRGVAHESDLIIVKTTFDTFDIGLAVEYIVQKADSLGKPCVINMSLGGHYGPHNGTTALERVIDDESGVGKVMCVSAGNEGNDYIHAGDILETNESWETRFDITPVNYSGQQVAEIDIFVTHDKLDDFDLKLISPNDIEYSPTLNPHEEYLESDAEIRFFKKENRYTKNPEYVISIYQNNPALFLLAGWKLSVTSNQSIIGDIHSWILNGMNGKFTFNNSKSHLVGMPGTSFSAITVGSHNTKKEWTSHSGGVIANGMALGAISSFSSVGPTLDNRLKPDISAPGNYIMSAFSSDIPIRYRDPMMIHQNGQYQAMRGTSMSCPIVSGIVGIMLGHDPTMHFSEVKRRIIQAAKQDVHTGSTWNYEWGFGKINLAEILKQMGID